jgi:hypothetical protein
MRDEQAARTTIGSLHALSMPQLRESRAGLAGEFIVFLFEESGTATDPTAR